MQKYIIALTALLLTLPAIAYENCVITTNGKLTDIKIQHNDVVNVYPMVTIMNKKDTLIVQPLKEGETKFTVLKNNKDKYLFTVKIDEAKTEISPVKGFEILTIDCPPETYEYLFELDEPPVNNDKNGSDEEFDIDEPPVLRGEK